MELAMAVLLIVGIFGLSREGARLVSQQKKGEVTVVLDAGHGGADPGKIGVNGEKEKELNLEITLLLKKKLEEQKVNVVLTRESDVGLYDTGSNNKKVQDLQRRCELIHKTAPLCTVSIHQNSYTTPDVKGAQVFYYTHSAEGKRLAEGLQTALVEGVDPSNHRQAKGNTSYYLLKKTDVPIAIVECGFLSNPGEAQLLTTEEYQEKLADAICNGILQYLKLDKKSEKAIT
ncbi:MAG TPA: N-acetylmuramoyl-L-alanine amidase [Candidatus Pelethocola excrementipullorum]|nr:N-acetylmuramoyl-L-alanine amidase [Candidatus Pelethocola excrementipullorum]